jgi:hypothetical protein
VLRDADLQLSDEPFELIQHANRLNFLRLAGELEGLGGPLATVLRTMCRFQLETLSHCFGARDV